MLKRLPVFVTIALLSVISVFNYSCNPRDRIETNEGFQRKPVPLGELKDAQIWFTHYYSSIKPNKEFLRTSYHWEKAKRLKYKNGFEVVLIPMTEPNHKYVSPHIRHLVINRGENNKYFHRIIEIVPDDDYVNEKGKFNYSMSDFSGVVLSWNLEKGFKKGVDVFEGVPVGYAKLIDLDEETHFFQTQTIRRQIPVAQPANPYTQYLIQTHLFSLGYNYLDYNDGGSPNEYGGGGDDAYIYGDYFVLGSGGGTFSYNDYFYDGVNPDIFQTPTDNFIGYYPLGRINGMTYEYPNSPNLESEISSLSYGTLPSNYFSCTTQGLRDLASSKGWTTGMNAQQINNFVGRMFEEAVYRALQASTWNLTGNFSRHSTIASPARNILTQGVYNNVVPDIKFSPYVTSIGVAQFYDNIFIEVKAVNGYLYPSHSNHQLSGMIDALSGRTPTGTVPPALVLVTTNNTQISSGLINLATNRSVQIFRIYTFMLGDQLIVTFPIPLNYASNLLYVPTYILSPPVTIQIPGSPDVGPDPEDIID